MAVTDNYKCISPDVCEQRNIYSDFDRSTESHSIFNSSS